MLHLSAKPRRGNLNRDVTRTLHPRPRWCYHFRRSSAQARGEYEEPIRARSRRRSHRAHRLAAARDAAAVGKDGRGADDGPLFQRARYGRWAAQAAAHIDWKVDRAAREAGLYEREALLAQQP